MASGFKGFIQDLKAFMAEERQHHESAVTDIMKSLANEPERLEKMRQFHSKLDAAAADIAKRAEESKRKPAGQGQTAKQALSRFSEIRNGIRAGILAGEISADEAAVLETRMNHCIDGIVSGGSAPAQPWELAQPEPVNPPDRDNLQDAVYDGPSASIRDNVRVIKVRP